MRHMLTSVKTSLVQGPPIAVQYSSQAKSTRLTKSQSDADDNRNCICCHKLLWDHMAGRFLESQLRTSLEAHQRNVLTVMFASTQGEVHETPSVF